MKETVVNPLGLVTAPNEYGQYPVGALARADNCALRAPGLISPYPVSEFMADITGVAPRRLVSTGPQLLAITDTAIYWIESGGTVTKQLFQQFDLTFGGSGSDHKRIPTQTFRDRTFVRADQGIIAADYTDPTNATEQAFRWAGLSQPLIKTIALANATTGLALVDNDVVTYAVTIERKYSDGYLLISEPSPLQRVKCPAGSGPTSISLVVAFGQASTLGEYSGYQAGDVLRIWRSAPVQSVGLGLNTESGVTLMLAKTYTLTAGDITNQFTGAIVDDAKPESLTEELYTNPGQETLQSIRQQPPIASTMAVLDGFTFYGDCTTRAEWDARFPYGLGNLDLGTSANRARGIGVRSISSGTFGAGSTDITGVSAAQYVGLAVGQRLYGNANATGRFISALPGGGVVRMNSASPGAGAATGLYSVDIVQVNGDILEIPDLYGFIQSAVGATNGAFWYSFITKQTVAYRETPTTTSPGVLQLVYNQGFSMLTYRHYVDTLTDLNVRATNGSNYDPPVSEYSSGVNTTFTETRTKNQVYYSWNQQPEAVAPGNYLSVGRGEIYASVAQRDGILYFCSDGLYRLTGYGTRSSGIGAQWRVDQVDRTLILTDPNSFTILRDIAYAMTSRGLVAIDGTTVSELTTKTLSDVLPGQRWLNDGTATAEYCAIADEDHNEVLLAVTGLTTEIYLFNADQRAFSKITAYDEMCASCLTFFPKINTLAFAREASEDVQFVDLAGDGNTMIIDYQPTSAEDPASSKQWSTMTVICALADAGTQVVPRYNGVSLPGAAGLLLARANDARFNFGVARSAPAIAATLSPGVEIGAPLGGLRFRGLSLRFEALSEQQVFR